MVLYRWNKSSAAARGPPLALCMSIIMPKPVTYESQKTEGFLTARACSRTPNAPESQRTGASSTIWTIASTKAPLLQQRASLLPPGTARLQLKKALGAARTRAREERMH